MPSDQGAVAPEDAVRLYLMYLSDPGSLRDEDEVKRLQAQVSEARDPIAKLRAVAALERAEAVDSAQYEADFIDNAKAFAESEGITASAFRQLGVSDGVLRQAGFEVQDTQRERRPSRAQAAAPRQRAKSVSVEGIKQYVRGLKGSFVLSEIMEGVGGSPATVRKAVDDLVESGEVEKLGPMPDYRGRGRVPTQYARAAA